MHILLTCFLLSHCVREANISSVHNDSYIVMLATMPDDNPHKPAKDKKDIESKRRNPENIPDTELPQQNRKIGKREPMETPL